MSDPSTNPIVSALAAGAEANIPLAGGLRSAASEISGRDARQLNLLADRLEAGMDLEAALAEGNLMSKHWVGLIQNGLRAGDLGQMLAEMASFHAARRSLRAEFLAAIAYPAFLLSASLVFAAFALLLFAPIVRQTLSDFQVGLPPATMLALAAGDLLLQTAWITITSSLCCMLFARLLLGRRYFAWLATTVPVFGPLVWWIGTWEWLELLRPLVARGIGLPDALRMTASATRGTDLSAATREFADQIEAGQSLQRLLIHSASLPNSIAPILGWGEQNNVLADALKFASEAMAERVRLRIHWLRVVIPPIMFLIIAAIVSIVLAATLLPLTRLIQDLA